MKRIQRKLYNHQSEKEGATRQSGLSGGLDGAFLCQVPGFATVVAVDFARLAALDSDVANFTTPTRGENKARSQKRGLKKKKRLNIKHKHNENGQ